VASNTWRKISGITAKEMRSVQSGSRPKNRLFYLILSARTRAFLTDHSLKS
jgi:hypothetical protein